MPKSRDLQECKHCRERRVCLHYAPLEFRAYRCVCLACKHEYPGAPSIGGAYAEFDTYSLRVDPSLSNPPRNSHVLVGVMAVLAGALSFFWFLETLLAYV